MRMALLTVLTSALLTLTSGASGAAAPSGDWTGFGRTVDNMRHSPLTQITSANVAQLGRAYTLDFKQVDPDVRRGEQSYPLAIGGTLYVTTNDANVFAIDGATGKILWHFNPSNSGLFKNFGIVANRGLAYCDGALFLLTLDMHLNKLNPADGALLGRVAIGDAVPGAASNYGYSETSAPICADHRVIAGAAGSEYGVRGYVMAWTTDLRPAWPNPVWTIPPEQQSWRSLSRIVGGGAVWTPVTVDESIDTVFFGTGSATPLYFPSLRPGPNPRTDALIAVDLKTGAIKWWRQLISGNQWSYDVAQPPIVYDGKVGGRTRHVVSVATMEGVWHAFDAATGAPFYSRVKVIDRVEHPALRPGQPVTVFPASIGGLNYSPASYDPTTDYVVNAAAETAAVDIQAKLTPTQKKHKFVLGDVFLGLSNGNFGTELAGWHDHGSISAIDVNTGKRVWKFATPEPERGGVRRRHPASASPEAATACCARSRRRQDRSVDLPDRPPDRGRADDLLGRREGVRCNHRRRNTHLVERRGVLSAAGLHTWRLRQAIAGATARSCPHFPVGHGAAGGRDAGGRPRFRHTRCGWRTDLDTGALLGSRVGALRAQRAGGRREAAARRPPVAGAAMEVDGYQIPDRTDKQGRSSAST